MSVAPAWAEVEVGTDVDGFTTLPPVAVVCPPPMHAEKTTPEARAATGRSGKRTRRFLRLPRPSDKLSRGAVSGRPFRRRMSRELTLTPTRRRECLQRSECSLRSAESSGSSSSSSLCLCSLAFSRAGDNS